MIRRLLIVNRGEIAVRIIRTCKEMNIETVAVYSTADKEALHVQLADYAVCIGGPRANDSYLNMKNILSAACMTACDAIHPGFGFLSENAKFARLVLQCGLIFVGPNPDVIEQMGDKNNARRCMMKAGVPVIPGSEKPVSGVEEAVRIAEEAGYPVILKAAAGGGGRGMRRADNAGEIARNFELVRNEARKSFGNDDIFVEKFLEEPKHIEVQILADTHGDVKAIGTRDCSLQRRNQKLIEEAPAPFLSDAITEHLKRTAVAICRKAGYVSAELWNSSSPTTARCRSWRSTRASRSSIRSPR